MPSLFCRLSRGLNRAATGRRIAICAEAEWCGRHRLALALDVLLWPYDALWWRGWPPVRHCAAVARSEGLGPLPDPIARIRPGL